jgi:hypothetical protein
LGEEARINRLSTIQEHNMIRQAIDKGFCPRPDRLRTAQHRRRSIREKQGLLRGIAAEAAAPF